MSADPNEVVHEAEALRKIDVETPNAIAPGNQGAMSFKASSDVAVMDLSVDPETFVSQAYVGTSHVMLKEGETWSDALSSIPTVKGGAHVTLLAQNRSNEPRVLQASVHVREIASDTKKAKEPPPMRTIHMIPGQQSIPASNRVIQMNAGASGPAAGTPTRSVRANDQSFSNTRRVRVTGANRTRSMRTPSARVEASLTVSRANDPSRHVRVDEGSATIRHLISDDMEMVLPNADEHTVVLLTGNAHALLRYTRSRAPLPHATKRSLASQLSSALNTDGAVGRLSQSGGEVLIALKKSEIQSLVASLTGLAGPVPTETADSISRVVAKTLGEQVVLGGGETTHAMLPSSVVEASP